MLRQLRRKFVIITMVLAGSMLVAVLGSTLLSTRSTQSDLIDETLSRAMANNLDIVFPLTSFTSEVPAQEEGPGQEEPDFGRTTFGMGDRGRRGRDTSLPTVVVDISYDGTLTETSVAVVGATSDLLGHSDEIIDDVLRSGSANGTIPSLHVAWRRMSLAGDGIGTTYRVAIVDTKVLDSALTEQAKNVGLITVGALAALFVVVWWLSGWALRPVARAWDEQRRFVADASHELKTPLSVIIANSEILVGDDTLPAESRHWVASTAEEAEHMKGLVNDLLELARADESAAGGAASALRRVDVDFSELVDSAVLEFDAVAFERGCTLDAEIVPNCHVSGDSEWLGRVVRILVDNACKYAQAGTVVRVSLRREVGKCVLAVNNRGTVIGPQDLPHVFERFYRSDKVRTRGTGGFGLGLAIAKSIVESHGGRIGCASNEKDGTTFMVLLSAR